MPGKIHLNKMKTAGLGAGAFALGNCLDSDDDDSETGNRSLYPTPNNPDRLITSVIGVNEGFGLSLYPGLSVEAYLDLLCARWYELIKLGKSYKLDQGGEHHAVALTLNKYKAGVVEEEMPWERMKGGRKKKGR